MKTRRFLSLVLSLALAIPLAVAAPASAADLAYDVPGGKIYFDANTGAILSKDFDAEGYTPSGSTGSSVDEAGAQAIALADAGVAEADTVYLRIQPDYDDGRLVYDVEFYADGSEYDYEIDAVSGQILSVDRDIESYTPAAGTASNSGTAASGDIGEAAAKQAALSHAGLSESDVTFVKVERDYDDGRLVYEVEFYHGTNEYDYEIAASDGSILSYDYDAESYTPPKSSGASVTAEQAKQLAFSHAGVNEADVRALEMDTDHDDGRTVYEFEWKVGRTEYSCEIDASTGAVVSFEKEVD